MESNITIVTAPVHFGKTSILMNWIKTKDKVGGILTPDIDGLRKILRIRDGKIFSFQLANEVRHPKEDRVDVGKFSFSREAFEIAKIIIEEDFNNKHAYVLIDELGKLEMSDKGLEPTISNLILKAQKQKETQLIIVIRDYLLEDAIVKFKLEDASVVRLNENLIFSI